jgi:transposase InsO family protein
MGPLDVRPTDVGQVKTGAVHYRPQTHGKAERFIQSALREWAYNFTCRHSSKRTKALDRWSHHYSWHRTHQGIGGAPPLSVLNPPRNNLLALHTESSPSSNSSC